MLMLTLITISLFVICYLIGDFLQIVFKYSKGFGIKVISGYLFAVIIFHIMSLPFMYLELKFNTLFYLYITTIIILLTTYVVISLIKKRFNFLEDIRNIFNKENVDRWNIILWIVVFILIYIQLRQIFLYIQPNIDDQFYVSQITTMLNRNRIMDIMPSSGESIFAFPDIYKMVSFETWLGVICKIFVVSPAALCHTYIVPFFVILSYVSVYKVGKELFDKQANIFLIFYGLLNIFSGFSTYTQGAFLLLRIWQGKAVMVNIIMPLVLFVFIKIIKENKVNYKKVLFLYALLIGAFHTSTVGLVFIPLAYGVYSIVYLIYSRKFKEFLKLLIPAVLCIPFVFIKIYIMLRQTSFDSFSTGIKDLDYSQVISNFTGESHIVLILAISLIILIIKRNKLLTYVFLLYTLLLFVFFLNPFVAKFMATKITGVAVYWRLFWLIQSGILISAAFTHVSTIIKKNIPKIIIIILLSFLITYSGTTIFTDKLFPKGTNIEQEKDSFNYIFINPKDIEYEKDYDPILKISLINIEMVEIIKEIQEKEKIESVNLLTTETRSLEIRQFSDINLVWFNYVIEYYNVAGLYSDEKRIYDLYTNIYLTKKWDVDELIEDLDYFDVDFIVMKVSAVKLNDIPSNFEKLYQDDIYILYRIREN